LELFFDKISEGLFRELSKAPNVRSQVLLNIHQFEIGQSYVTLNIQGGRPGIELQGSLFKIKNPENQDPLRFAYIRANLIQTGKIFVRKLPVIGIRDWLLIYEDTLVELSVKDSYDELEIVVV
jgi:hypothetical protein